MDQQGNKGIWSILRKKNRKELDKVQRDLVMGRHEQREYAGDPRQPQHQWVKLKK